MDIRRPDVEPYVAVVGAAYSSLWFLMTAMLTKNHNRTINDVYRETIGRGAAIGEDATNVNVFNQGTCLIVAYMLLVVPKEANFRAFIATEDSKLNFSKFTRTDGKGNSWNGPFSLTLNMLRNGIAHANFRIIPDTSRIQIWNCPNPENSQDRNFQAEVELRDLADFCDNYHTAWLHWANARPVGQ
jgi:hypothetical protein